MVRTAYWVLAGLLVASPALADFSGPFDVSNWSTTLTGNPPGGGGSVDLSGAPASITLQGGDSTCSVIGSCRVDFTIVAPESLIVTFDWAYSTSDGPQYDRFGFLLNGSFMELSDEAGPNTQSGTASFLTAAGDQFGFSIDCTDCAKGPADVVVGAFTVQPVGAIPALGPIGVGLLILALLASGALGLRRFRR